MDREPPGQKQIPTAEPQETQGRCSGEVGGQRGDDDALTARLTEPAQEHTGIFHLDNEAGSRGGFSLYVPEYYTPDRAWPLVMALHGGSGDGRGFLWSWLRDARSFGAILVAPTATADAAMYAVKNKKHKSDRSPAEKPHLESPSEDHA